MNLYNEEQLLGSPITESRIWYGSVLYVFLIAGIIAAQK